ncbi:female-specific lacrimal gland protein-like isoform X1 [Lepus europaeus]|uniref:female-specific lacrimal gland protein-like isoform X1 n=1 Tax=Lepus europaeus TaxID=9983 RepID=UPI002B472D65|nr:female-specific lacrimal gland protein-like isoform X1 [Lepus europaeus]
MMKTMAMKMTTVMKALLLALALAVACADPAQISGPWCTFAIAADNLDQVQEGGPHRMLLRHVECQEDCNTLNVFFYVRKNRVCTPHTVMARKNADDVYTADFEGQNYFQLVGRDPDSLIVINNNVRPDGTTTHVSFLFVGADSCHSQIEGHKRRAAGGLREAHGAAQDPAGEHPAHGRHGHLPTLRTPALEKVPEHSRTFQNRPALQMISAPARLSVSSHLRMC